MFSIGIVGRGFVGSAVAHGFQKLLVIKQIFMFMIKTLHVHKIH